MQNKKRNLKPWQFKLHQIIFESDTLAGKVFDILLLVFILLSIIVVMLESIPSLTDDFGFNYTPLFITVEWFFTIVFTIEYLARILSINKPLKYIFSFYGIIDLLSILPTYLGLFISNDTNSLMVIRSLRLMRVFRILKLGKFIKESKILVDSIKASRHKIFVFLLSILTLVIILGTIMYMIETEKNSDFTSIPRSIYWAIVTLTTVGYGDIAPVTSIGQFIASIVMILGYAIIAVPTGMVTAQMIKSDSKSISNKSCSNCSKEGHDSDAKFCKFCGESI